MNAVKIEERTNESTNKVECDEDKEKHEKTNEWSKPITGGPRVGHVEYEK